MANTLTSSIPLHWEAPTTGYREIEYSRSGQHPDLINCFLETGKLPELDISTMRSGRTSGMCSEVPQTLSSQMNWLVGTSRLGSARI